MDRQDTIASTTEMPAQPHKSTIPSTSALSGRQLAVGEVKRACSIAQAVVTIASGQPELQSPSEARHGRRAAFERQIAMYLAHVGYGLSMAQIGRAFGRDRTTVVHACHLIEDRRDDDRFDIVLDHLEQAAAALRAADGLTRRD